MNEITAEVPREENYIKAPCKCGNNMFQKMGNGRRFICSNCFSSYEPSE